MREVELRNSTSVFVLLSDVDLSAGKRKKETERLDVDVDVDFPFTQAPWISV